MNVRTPIRSFGRLLLTMALAPAFAMAQGPHEPLPEPQQADPAVRRGRISVAQADSPTAPGNLFEEKSGSMPVREGMRLKVSADLGNIVVRTDSSSGSTPTLSYRVRAETMASEPDAAKLLQQFVFGVRSTKEGVVITAQAPGREIRGRLWATLEFTVPQSFSLDLQTQAGNVEIASVNGRVILFTAGGNVIAERIGGGARIETLGGHITVQDVHGELTALTQGGHVSVGHVRGDAVVRTGGGHVRVASVQGVAELESGGGNIFLEKAGANVTASTLGGRIDFGEASGGIRARTGGGSIGVYKVAGPTEIESSGGSICLTNVQGAIRATTATGLITAWFVSAGPEGRLKGPSQLESGQGDIIVFVPRAMPLTIEATIESSAENRIEYDPSLPVKLSYAGASGRRTMRGDAVLNGGGEVLRLRTLNGNIRLRYADSATQSGQQLEQALFEQSRRQLEIQRRALESQLKRQEILLNQQVQERMKEAQREISRLTLWRLKLEALVSGSIWVAPREQSKKLVFSPRPTYPSIARSQGVQGRVRLEVTVSKDGKVELVRVLQGHPLLSAAAEEAVKQWRYSPTLLDGQPVAVVTNVDIEFR
jgi:TonB family protein